MSEWAGERRLVRAPRGTDAAVLREALAPLDEGYDEWRRHDARREASTIAHNDSMDNLGLQRPDGMCMGTERHAASAIPSSRYGDN